MNSINKYRLRHPFIMSIFIIGMAIVSALAIFNALRNGVGSENKLWGFIPAIFTVLVIAHARFPTKMGWWILVIGLIGITASGIFIGLFSVYSDLVSKYSLIDLLKLTLVDLITALAVAFFLYSSSVAPHTSQI